MPAKATKAFLEWNRRTSPISAMSCGPSVEPTLNISMTTGYSVKEAAKDCISCLSAASAAEVALGGFSPVASIPFGFYGGPDGIRTHDLSDANKPERVICTSF